MNRLEVREQVLCCTGCELVTVGSGPVPFSGPTPAHIAVLGEAPGRQEDEDGEPFVGRSGELLRDLLRRAGFDISRLFFWNSASCYPNGTPSREHLNACASNWRAQLEVADPVWVLVLGNVALSMVRPGVKVTRARRHIFCHHERYWFPTFHPSAALRATKTEVALAEDLAAFRAITDGGSWREHSFETCLKCGMTMDDAEEHDVEMFYDDGGGLWCEPCAPVSVLRPEGGDPPQVQHQHQRLL